MSFKFFNYWKKKSSNVLWLVEPGFRFAIHNNSLYIVFLKNGLLLTMVYKGNFIDHAFDITPANAPINIYT